jgi:hypothetical protein
MTIGPEVIFQLSMTFLFLALMREMGKVISGKARNPNRVNRLFRGEIEAQAQKLAEERFSRYKASYEAKREAEENEELFRLYVLCGVLAKSALDSCQAQEEAESALALAEDRAERAEAALKEYIR